MKRKSDEAEDIVSGSVGRLSGLPGGFAHTEHGKKCSHVVVKEGRIKEIVTNELLAEMWTSNIYRRLLTSSRLSPDDLSLTTLGAPVWSASWFHEAPQSAEAPKVESTGLGTQGELCAEVNITVEMDAPEIEGCGSETEADGDGEGDGDGDGDADGDAEPAPPLPDTGGEKKKQKRVPQLRVLSRERRVATKMTASQMVYELSKANIDPHLLVTPHRYGQGFGAGSNESQPFDVKVHPQVGFLTDLHGHLCQAEVIGLLAGKWDPEEKVLYIQAPFPCASTERHDNGATDVELDPVAELQAREVIYSMGMLVVGWYHSHPRFRPDPSVTDIRNQQQYQNLMRDAETGISPFVGLIVSTYDSNLRSPASHHQWFHTKPYAEARKKAQNFVHIPMMLEAEVLSYLPMLDSLTWAESFDDSIEKALHKLGPANAASAVVGSVGAIDLTSTWGEITLKPMPRSLAFKPAIGTYHDGSFRKKPPPRPKVPPMERKPRPPPKPQSHQLYPDDSQVEFFHLLDSMKGRHSELLGNKGKVLNYHPQAHYYKVQLDNGHVISVRPGCLRKPCAATSGGDIEGSGESACESEAEGRKEDGAMAIVPVEVAEDAVAVAEAEVVMDNDEQQKPNSTNSSIGFRAAGGEEYLEVSQDNSAAPNAKFQLPLLPIPALDGAHNPQAPDSNQLLQHQLQPVLAPAITTQTAADIAAAKLAAAKEKKSAYRKAYNLAKKASASEDSGAGGSLGVSVKADQAAATKTGLPKSGSSKPGPKTLLPARATLSLLQLLQRPIGSSTLARSMLLRAPPPLRCLILGAVTLCWYYAHSPSRVELYGDSVWKDLRGGDKMLASLRLGWAKAGLDDEALSQLGAFFAAAWDEGREI